MSDTKQPVPETKTSVKKQKQKGGSRTSKNKTAKPTKSVSLEKPQGAVGAQVEKKKNRHARHMNSDKIYLDRMRKQMHPDLSFDKSALSVLTQLSAENRERVAESAGRLSRRRGRSTLTVEAIETAAHLAYPASIAKVAVEASKKAVERSAASLGPKRPRKARKGAEPKAN